MFIKSAKYKKIHKLLRLDKPLIIFDIEMTGISLSSDKIIELAYIKIWGDGRIKKVDMLINPEEEILPESTAIHGLMADDLEDKPAFRDRAQEIWDIFYDCYYGGYNILEFALPVLRREFVRVGMDFNFTNKQVIDSKKIYKYMAPANLVSAYEYYCRKRITNRESVLTHTENAAEVLASQLERYKETRSWDFINQIHEADNEFRADNIRKFYWEKSEACFAFSKYKGRPLSWVAENDPEFLRWILDSDFTRETKHIVKMALNRISSENKI